MTSNKAQPILTTPARDHHAGAIGDHEPPENATGIQSLTGKAMSKDRPPSRPGSASVLEADNQMSWRLANE